MLTLYVTLLYLVFYSISSGTEKVLDQIDYTFKSLAIFVLVYIFLEAELLQNSEKISWLGDTSLVILLSFLTVIVGLTVIIMA